MQEVQTNKSEKLVPIDTSGEAIDIELKEDKVENVNTEEVSSDTPIVEVQEENTPAVETKEEELEEYSVGVKKRIDKLTKKMREAERREQAAIDYAKQVKSESDKLKSTNIVQNESMLVDREKALVNQKEFAKRLLDIKLNSLNSLVSCFYEISFNFHVGRNCFRPTPKVDSSVVSFNRKKEPLIKKNEIDSYINFKRKLFSHKRKTLKNLLKDYKIDNKFDLSMRVEDLELKKLIKIFRTINI